MSPQGLHPRLSEQVLAKLGFNDFPSINTKDLAALYEVWCKRVPFDNIQKRMVFSTGRAPEAPLPGATPEDFFAEWLHHGTGGTCWTGSYALYAFLQALGFDVALVTVTMVTSPDVHGPNHGMTIVGKTGSEAAQFVSFQSQNTRKPHRHIAVE